MRRAKIVCTMGPAVESSEKVHELIAAGMNMARLNLSHGTYVEHQSRLDAVRSAAKKAGVPVAILVDLQGPKIRVGKFAENKILLKEGDKFTLDVACELGDQTKVGLDYKELPGDVKPGDRLLLNDGLVVLTVESVKGGEIFTVVECGSTETHSGGSGSWIRPAKFHFDII